MALPQGINFRLTEAYDSPEGTNNAFSGSTPDVIVYPQTTPQGNTVGWEVALQSDIQCRNRDAGNDVRLAGIHFSSDNGDENFRIDLPNAGNYNIGLASGDATYACPVPVDLYDTNSSLGSLSTGSTSTGNNFKDATNTEYSAANWVLNQTRVQKTFATTICRFRLLGNASASRMAHVYIESASAAVSLMGDGEDAF